MDGSGEGALTVSQYAGNPAGAPSFSTAGTYFDVQVAAGSSFTTLTISDCNLNGGTTLYWWNGSSWVAVSPQHYAPGSPPCVTATLSAMSTPTIAELTGTVFAAGTPPPSSPPSLPPAPPHPPAPVFHPFWVESFVPTITLWSGEDQRAVALGRQGQWSYFLVVAPQTASRLFVYNPATRNYAYVDADVVGPSGPPPAS